MKQRVRHGKQAIVMVIDEQYEMRLDKNCY